MSTQISRSLSLSTVPPRKIIEALLETVKTCETCIAKEATLSNACSRCMVINIALQRYADSNIPLKYWKLEMDRDFKGEKILLDTYLEVTKDLKDTYNKGVCLCFSGTLGSGKSFTMTNILKRATEKGYSAHYATLTDIVSAMISSSSEDKSIARRQLLTVDFLVIDEFDPRYIGSDQAADLFGRVLEDIFRTRCQNNMPIFMATNSPRVVDSFNGSLKQSITSLMNYVKVITVIGKDYRKQEKQDKVK